MATTTTLERQEDRDRAEVAEWEAILPTLPEGSDDRRLVEHQLEMLRRSLAESDAYARWKASLARIRAAHEAKEGTRDGR